MFQLVFKALLHNTPVDWVRCPTIMFSRISIPCSFAYEATAVRGYFIKLKFLVCDYQMLGPAHGAT